MLPGHGNDLKRHFFPCWNSRTIPLNCRLDLGTILSPQRSPPLQFPASWDTLPCVQMDGWTVLCFKLSLDRTHTHTHTHTYALFPPLLPVYFYCPQDPQLCSQNTGRPGTCLVPLSLLQHSTTPTCRFPRLPSPHLLPRSCFILTSQASPLVVLGFRFPTSFFPTHLPPQALHKLQNREAMGGTAGPFRSPFPLLLPLNSGMALFAAKLAFTCCTASSITLAPNFGERHCYFFLTFRPDLLSWRQWLRKSVLPPAWKWVCLLRCGCCVFTFSPSLIIHKMIHFKIISQVLPCVSWPCLHLIQIPMGNEHDNWKVSSITPDVFVYRKLTRLPQISLLPRIWLFRYIKIVTERRKSLDFHIYIVICLTSDLSPLCLAHIPINVYLL